MSKRVCSHCGGTGQEPTRRPTGCAAMVNHDCCGYAHAPRPCSRHARPGSRFCASHERVYRLYGTEATVNRPARSGT
jgi:hypothetical protein